MYSVSNHMYNIYMNSRRYFIMSSRTDWYLFLWMNRCAEERIVSAGVDVTGRDVAMVACIRVCYDWNLLFSPARSSPCCCAASSCSRRSRIGITFLVPSPRTLGTP